MPFKSQAQRRWMAEQVKLGKMTKETFNEWNSGVTKKLPERVHWPKGQELEKIKTIKPAKVKK